MFLKFSLLFCIPVFAVSMQGAAIVNCSQPGFSQTVYNASCSVGSQTGDALVYQGITSASIVAGQYVVTGLADMVSGPARNSGPYPMQASANWDDFFALPTSSPTDVLKVTVTGGGLNHPAFIRAGSINYAESDFCDAHYIGNPVCTQHLTISAGSLSNIELGGSDSVTIPFECGSFGCGQSPNASLYELVTVQRFLADGVTSDPFTTVPEPSSLTLLLLAIPGALAIIKRRSNC